MLFKLAAAGLAGYVLYRYATREREDASPVAFAAGDQRRAAGLGRQARSPHFGQHAAAAELATAARHIKQALIQRANRMEQLGIRV